MTASTTQQVFNHIVKDNFYDEILYKFFNNKEERDEFRQELWLMLGDMAPEKIIKAWNDKYFKYLYVRIISNQVKSSNSKWQYNKKFDMEGFKLVTEFHTQSIEDDIIKEETKKENQTKLSIIDKAINHLIGINPHFIIESQLFKMHHQDGLTYREISSKTNIPATSVFEYIQSAQVLIKGHIKKHYNK